MANRVAKLRIPVITGPTAVGKTDIAVQLAEEISGEIISADSRQIYRQLSIGTAKPDVETLARVPHHFIDELDLNEPFSAGIFLEGANRRISEILERGNVPIVTGGSTLYVHALLHGLSDIPDVPVHVRRRVSGRLEAEGQEALFAELQRIDPATAASMDSSKTQRLVRAIEVFEATGTALSELHANRPEPPYRYRAVVLTRDRGDLYRRINRRVEVMLESGLIDEVRELLAAGYDPAVNALQTIGYREVLAHLAEDGDIAALTALIQRNTRRYAKRQLTWFRRDPNYVWIDASSPYATVRDALVAPDALAADSSQSA